MDKEIQEKLSLTVPDDVRDRWNTRYALDLEPGCSFMTVLLTVSKRKQDFFRMVDKIESAIITHS